MKKHYNILIVSAYPPSRSAGLAQDMMTGFEREGHVVDFFTMYAFRGQKDNQYNIYPEPVTDKLRSVKQMFPFLQTFKKVAKVFFKTPEDKMTSVENHGYRIPHYNEAEPPVDDETLRRFLPDKKYDFVMVYVTERMITTPSFITIYNKYKVPLLIVCMDMMHLTGGCYFFGDCRRFSVGCGKCLVLDSDDPNDQTHKNYLIKKKVYQQIEYAMICNLYQKQFLNQCGLFDSNKIFNVPTIINEDIFVPCNKSDMRRHFHIPDSKKKIILSRYDKRITRSKGYDHLINIINCCYNILSKEERDEYALVLIGSKHDSDFASMINMSTIFLGMLDLQDLVRSYSAATVFVSTSIDDAGPSMVNQSMMCGTPVVTFSIGTALEVTINGVNGFMTSNFNDNEFANNIIEICRKSDDEFEIMCNQTRQSAVEQNSISTNAKKIIDIYQTLLGNKSNLKHNCGPV